MIFSVFALLSLCVLIGLGTWQVQRLQWKTALEAKIAERLNATPMTLDEVMDLRQAGGDVDYRPITVTGTFDHAHAVRVYELGGGKAGWHIYTPLKLKNLSYVFVNRGFAPDPLDGTDIVLNEPAGVVTVAGIVRVPPSETSMFTPKSETEKRRFYWRDFSNMVGAIHNKMEVSFAPVFVEQSAASAAGISGTTHPWPQAGVTRVKLSNRHLEYAITWYGLALALAGVYAFFMFGGRRRNDGDTAT